ncbi:MAG: hypothetical protein A3H67_01330 [Candidatus Buchananbacteria bacterium RIFCSPLOWO2_02_FULL_46_11b]|uniref:Lipoprotein n=1 Tax=Candidatus Buchananbacteria bacterium RIFCSPLOWO2_02_FULL_46_11b TaxID=1797548 RepID=A0A1G1Z2S4_9BACT|nr:MAG: hypothetical protein A3H67_01330 [Candidatus Buchananbacteria bacterium RIFCSPLOWO2_02_FULL_46_11b]
MKKIVVLCIVLAILAAGCATLVLSPEECDAVKRFDAIKLTAYDVRSIKEMGLDPNHLSAKDKLKVMEESKKVSPWIIP